MGLGQPPCAPGLPGAALAHPPRGAVGLGDLRAPPSTAALPPSSCVRAAQGEESARFPVLSPKPGTAPNQSRFPPLFLSLPSAAPKRAADNFGGGQVFNCGKLRRSERRPSKRVRPLGFSLPPSPAVGVLPLPVPPWPPGLRLGISMVTTTTISCHSSLGLGCPGGPSRGL